MQDHAQPGMSSPEGGDRAQDREAAPRPEAQEPGITRRFHAVELDRHIGERLRFVRRLSCLSQRHVAEEVGLSFQQVQKYENGTNRVSAALLAEFSGLFRLPMDWFIGPFNACLERDEAMSLSNYAYVLDRLYRAFHDRSDCECYAALELVCQVAGVSAGPYQTRLLRLRRTLQNGDARSQDLLREVVRRLAESNMRPAASTARVAAPTPGASFNVLLVDDDPDVLATISASVISAGFSVKTAASGDEALSTLAAGTKVDIIVTDYAMVGMDGMELLAQAGQVCPGVPGIVVTGFAGSERLQSLSADVEVLSKPFRRMELIGRIRLLIDGAVKLPGSEATKAELPALR